MKNGGHDENIEIVVLLGGVVISSCRILIIYKKEKVWLHVYEFTMNDLGYGNWLTNERTIAKTENVFLECLPTLATRPTWWENFQSTSRFLLLQRLQHDAATA